MLTSMLPDFLNASEGEHRKANSIDFFPGFKKISINTSGAVINGVIGGEGPPLLLLHGFPQSHIEWHKIAPMLAKNYTVVATDLRGYGDSSKPEDGENHMGYSKRMMARDQVEVMEQLGFKTYKVIGHDRGARVGHRMALDYPKKVEKLVVMDIVPTYKLYATTNKEFATAYWHWFFLIQNAPLPETMILNSAEVVLRSFFFRGAVPQFIQEDVFSVYLNHFKDTKTIHAMCEDYRAGATIDLEHDKADMANKVECPVLALWGGNGAMDKLYNVLETWKERAINVSGKSLPCGHWMPEQLPEHLYEEVHRFMTQA